MWKEEKFLQEKEEKWKKKIFFFFFCLEEKTDQSSSSNVVFFFFFFPLLTNLELFSVSRCAGGTRSFPLSLLLSLSLLSLGVVEQSTR